MPRLTIALDPQDVHSQTIVDPSVLVRLSPPNAIGTATARVAFGGQPQQLTFENGPPGPVLTLRLTPNRYRDAGVTCTVDGSGVVTPVLRGQPLMLPRRPTQWTPVFTPWHALPDEFARLQSTLVNSRHFQVGRFTDPVQFIEEAYDAPGPADEPRQHAKICLLNLFSRLRVENAPGLGGTWLDEVQELLLATRERLLAVVSDRCGRLVHRLSTQNKGDYRRASPKLHLKNFRALPSVEAVARMASVKTRDVKANLQFTVAHARRHGQAVWLLDADIDENGTLLGHSFDVVKHFFTGGTHPVDIHEALQKLFDPTPIGYELQPVMPVPEVRARVLGHAAALPVVHAPAFVVEADVTPLSRMMVLGDSVTWGQGLLEQQKMHTLVAQASSRAGSMPAIHVAAHSGATIGVGGMLTLRPPVPGEVPRAHPTILEQSASMPASLAASVDLVLVNGGINDVDIRFILSPYTDANDLADTTARACGADLAVLLSDVAHRFPMARVVVLTYYPMLSVLSRFSSGREFLDALGAPPPVAMMASDPATRVPAVWDRIVANCGIFHAASTTAIMAAVAGVNAQLDAPRFAVADAGFTADNAALAPDPWLFGVNWDLSPQDPIALDRRRACDLFEPDAVRRQQCYRASAGHPNAQCAQRYAAAILQALTGLAVPAGLRPVSL